MQVTLTRRVFLMVGLLMALGCMYVQAETLHFEPSTEIEAGLQTGDLAEDYSFYYSGSEAEPHTIIGVLNTILFEPSLWQPVGSDRTILQSWYEMIDNPYRDRRSSYFGGYIRDSQGLAVGVWYSKHRYRNSTISEDGIMTISRPFIKNRTSRPGRLKR